MIYALILKENINYYYYHFIFYLKNFYLNEIKNY